MIRLHRKSERLQPEGPATGAGRDAGAGRFLGEVLRGQMPLAEMVKHLLDATCLAVPAQGHLLEVQLPDGGRLVQARGLGNALKEVLGGDAVRPGASTVHDLHVFAVPIRAEDAGGLSGVLAVVGRGQHHCTAVDLARLGTQADLASSVIGIRARSFRADRQQEAAARVLAVGRSLTAGRDLAATSQAVADAVPPVCGSDRSGVLLRDPSSGTLRVSALGGEADQPGDPRRSRAAAFRVDLSESAELRELVSKGAPVLMNSDSSLFTQVVLAEFGLSAVLAAPICSLDDEVVGMVAASWTSAPPSGLDRAPTKDLCSLAALIGVVVSNTRLVEQAREHATSDAVTGLANRASFDRRLQATVGQDQALGRPTSVLICAVGGLARIQAALGPDASDDAMRQLAGRLLGLLRRDDTVARYSGEEFAVLLPGVGRSTAEEVAARLRAMATLVHVGGDAVRVDLSVGIAGTGDPAGQAETVTSPDRLLQTAREDLTTSADLSTVQGAPGSAAVLLRLESDLQAALLRDEVQVHLQPQVDLRNGRVVGVEALARWSHPQHGPVGPDVFIPAAEASGLIHLLGEYVMRRACRAVADLNSDGLDLEVSVNVSVLQLQAPGFVEMVHRVLADTGVWPGQLTLEITESRALSELTTGRHRLDQLRAAGVGISIDDFGTGYSSLGQLNNLPVTEVKIDRSFTATLDRDQRAPLVAGIIALGQELGLRVVAEGVETCAQLRVLHELGCERVQGYLFGPAVEPAALRRLLLSGQRALPAAAAAAS